MLTYLIKCVTYILCNIYMVTYVNHSIIGNIWFWDLKFKTYFFFASNILKCATNTITSYFVLVLIIYIFSSH